MKSGSGGNLYGDGGDPDRRIASWIDGTVICSPVGSEIVRSVS